MKFTNKHQARHDDKVIRIKKYKAYFDNYSIIMRCTVYMKQPSTNNIQNYLTYNRVI